VVKDFVLVSGHGVLVRETNNLEPRLDAFFRQQLIGVSSATVSRAFSPNGPINEATRVRVLAMAQQYGYQPNAIARSLNDA